VLSDENYCNGDSDENEPLVAQPCVGPPEKQEKHTFHYHEKEKNGLKSSFEPPSCINSYDDYGHDSKNSQSEYFDECLLAPPSFFLSAFSRPPESSHYAESSEEETNTHEMSKNENEKDFSPVEPSTDGKPPQKESCSISDTSDTDTIETQQKEDASMPYKVLLPLAARELITASVHKAVHYTRMYTMKAWNPYSDLGCAGGFHVVEQQGGDEKKEMGSCSSSDPIARLPPFSSLPWIDRQLVSEWRTINEEDTAYVAYAQRELYEHYEKRVRCLQNDGKAVSKKKTASATLTMDHNASTLDTNSSAEINDKGNYGAEDEDSSVDDFDDMDFSRARHLIPPPAPRPEWRHSPNCNICSDSFSSTLLRHHCRACGASVCNSHCSQTHRLPHLNYNPMIPERVCDTCKTKLNARDLMERVAWRLARSRDFLIDAASENNETNNGQRLLALTPYFATGVDTVHDAAIRLTNITLHLTRRIPLGAQATVAVETVEVLRKHGLHGVYACLLRKEFMAAANLLMEVSGINEQSWPLSVHELSAAIFYALAQHRLRRGRDPEREHYLHRLIDVHDDDQKGRDDTSSAWSSFVGASPDQCSNHSDHDALSISQDEEILAASPSTQENNKQSIVPGLPADQCSNGEDHDDVSLCQDEEILTASPFTQESNTQLILPGLPKPRGLEQNDPPEGSTMPATQDSRSFTANTLEEPLFTATFPPIDQQHIEANEPNNHLRDDCILNETDAFDPMAESVADLLDAADDAIQQHHKRTTTSKTNTPTASTKPVCTPLSNPTLSSLIFYAPLAVSFIYANTEVDMQLLAAQQGWTMLYAHLNQNDDSGNAMITDKPAYALFIHKMQRVACLSIRGTATMNDVVTDIRATPVGFPFEDHPLEEVPNHNFDGMMEDEEEWTTIPKPKGLALCGMARAATNLFRENMDVLLFLIKNGYRIRITGHSLGGGVAALLGVLVRKHLDQLCNDTDQQHQEEEEHQEQNKSNDYKEELKKSIILDGRRNDLLRVYGYGTPACVDARLANLSNNFCTTVVLHDDVIPRLTPTSVRCLLKHLLYIRETWVKAHLTNDIASFANRAKSGWAPRWRGGFVLRGQTPADNGSKNGHGYSRDNGGDGSLGSACLGSTWNDDKNRQEECKDQQHKHDEDIIRKTDADSSKHGFDPSLVDGERFYEAEETLVQSSDDEGCFDSDDDENDDGFFEGSGDHMITSNGKHPKNVFSTHRLNNKHLKHVQEEEDWEVPFDEPPLSSTTDNKTTRDNLREKDHIYGTQSAPSNVDACSNREENTGSPVMLEEAPLPRMFIPGKIVHIYTHRGGYKATYVPRNFRELRRVSLAGNMLVDHMSRSYYDALLEVRNIRIAEKDLPHWTGFNEGVTCSCCASRFTWASTSDSEAQEARDKYNCRSCGNLVCGPCSKNRASLPKIGIELPVRLCDRCYHDMGGLNAGGLNGDGRKVMMRSFIEDD